MMAGRQGSSADTLAAVAGLTQAEAERRLEERGALEPGASRSTRSIVLANVVTPFNAVLVALGVLTLLFSDWRDALFLGIVIANAGIGIAQELRAKRALDRLSALVAPRATVVRDGQVRELEVAQVVEGDLVRVAPGDQVVADGTLEQADGLALDESILTGESRPVARGHGEEVRSGSFVVEGTGAYAVEAVGEDSYAERIAGEAREFRHPDSPLQRSLNVLLYVLVAISVPLGVMLVVALVQQGRDTGESVEIAVAGLVTLVPEGLILLSSLTYAAAAMRMTRLGALSQQLNAIESLASVDTVCLDKTGTLTDGSLELIEIVPAPGVPESAARQILARVAAAGSVRSGTSDAISASLGGSPEETLAEVPFASRWKWSGAAFHDEVLVLGAPEALGAGPLATEVSRRQGERSRVLVFGRAASLPEVSGPGDVPATPPGFTPLGLAVLRERMRPEANEVVAYLRQEGVDLKVMSGDAPGTVAAVARAAGFPDTSTVTGADLPDDPAALEEIAAAHAIFARVTPDLKKALVEALARRGRYTAMVGDGVNDVAAMKAARIAIALGSGSQIARGVSDIVLVEDDFRSIPQGIVEGRRILLNIRRVAKLFVVKSAFAATLILTVGVAGAAYPLLPRQLSFAALFTVGLPAFVLAIAPSTGRPPKRNFTKDLMRFSVPGGVVSAIAVIVAYAFARSVSDVETGRTVALVVLVLTGLYLVLLL